MTTTPQRDGGLLIVDADTHLCEPWDLWTSRAPAKYRDRVPQVKDVDGEASWVFDGTVVSSARAAAVIDRDMVKHSDTEFLFNKTVDEVAAAASEVPARLELMDQQGIWAHIVYPNAIGFGGQQLGRIGDPEVRRLTASLYNDACAEIQESSRQRLFPIAIVPWWDLDFAVEEIARIKSLGLVGLNMVADPDLYGLPDLSEAYWQPLFDAIEDSGLPLNFHIGASPTQMNYYGTAGWPSFSNNLKHAIGGAMLYLGNARVIANFIYGGILERHPTLKFVSVESGVGWLPSFLQALDYQLLESAPEHQDVLSLKPSEYFRRQCAACFWFERELLVPAVEYLGVDNCLFETDFPHPTCLYPDPAARAYDLVDEVGTELASKLLGGNAARIYNLPLPDHVAS
jgi:predicted TIM-barrel fold metal-dependent hydrolase